VCVCVCVCVDFVDESRSSFPTFISDSFLSLWCVFREGVRPASFFLSLLFVSFIDLFSLFPLAVLTTVTECWSRWDEMKMGCLQEVKWRGDEGGRASNLG